MPLFFTVLSTLSFAIADSARAARSIVNRNYHCTIIASTREFPSGVSGFSAFGAPTMNAWGQVVFSTQAAVSGGTVQELRVGRGELSNGVPITHVVARGGETFEGPLAPFSSIEKAAIDDAARVTFLTYELSATGGGQGIYRVSTNHPASYKGTPIYTNQQADPGSEYSGFGTSTLDSNAAGSTVFAASRLLDEGAYYRSGDEIARNYANGIQTVNEPVLLHAGQPWTAFSASLDVPETGVGIWVNGVRRVQSSNGVGSFFYLSLSGNSSAVIAYARSEFAGIDSWEIAVTGPLNTSVYVDGDEDPFQPFSFPSGTSINVWSEVAFIAAPTGQSARLLIADGSQEIRRVICQNQVQDFGAPFFDYALSPRAINADGQIAFKGRVGTETFLVRADPLPGQGAPPTDCTGEAEGARCDDGDPITLSSCQANACDGNPLYDPPSSCAGLANHTACNDGDPSTISTCYNGVCLSSPLPVPEPVACWPGIAGIALLAALRGRRQRDARPAPRPRQGRKAFRLPAAGHLTDGVTVVVALFGLALAGPGFSAGPVIGWGDNSSGQTTPLASVSGSGTVSAISSGPGHSCAILSDDDAVVCWGQNTRGQAFPPSSVNGVDGSASAVAAGHSHSCAIQSGSGAVVCWGFNTSGQSTPPPSVNGTSGSATAIAAGTSFSCAIQSGSGAVVCWGDDSEGQATPPASVNGTSGTATAIVTGGIHACAIRSGTGAVVCWGNNIFEGQSTPPASVNGVAGTATALSAGGFHNCAIQSGSNAVVCWGDDSATAATPPAAVNGVGGTAVAIASSSGSFHTCAIQSGSSAAVCWGLNNFDQATPPASVDATSGTAAAIAPGGEHTCAIQSGSSAVVCWGGDDFNGQRTPPDSADGTGETATTIAAGGLHSCAIRSSTGGVDCWGNNSSGQATPPASVRGYSSPATAIAVGGNHSCAVRSVSSGAVVCWGSNGSGQATPPNSVNGASGNGTAIAAGEDHSCAIRAITQAVVCWGGNGSGQSTPPASVNGTAGTAAAIAAGGGHSCAIRAGTGAVICWGANGSGESTPPASVNGTSGSATSIAAGDDHSCAVRSGTGIVVCWGANGSGQSTPPGSVTAATGTASAISASDAHSCAIQAYSHAAVCWGANGSSQSTPPASVDGTGGGASVIAAGGGHALAIPTPVPEPGFGLSLATGWILLAALRSRIGSRRLPRSVWSRSNRSAGRGTRMKVALVRAAFAVLVTWVTVPESTAAPHPIVDRVYHCTLIARDPDLAPFSIDGMPSINAYGQVAFATGMPTDPFDSEVRVGYGDEVNGVPQTRRVARGSTGGSAPFVGVGAPSIDNGGRIAFLGVGFLQSFLGRGIFRVPFHAHDGSLPTPLVETKQSNPASPFNGIVGVPIAGTHDVLFKASYYENGAPPELRGLFRNDVLELAAPAREYAYDAGGSRAHAYLLDSGTFPNQVDQLFLGTQLIDSVPYQTSSWFSGLSVASNVGGSVSYGRFEDSGFEVRVWAGVPLVYVDSDDDALFAGGPSGLSIPTSINPYGEVALVAGDGAYTFRRVFVADGHVIHRVLCENDGIFAANIGSRAINGAGQIAFIGSNGSGQGVIARADPLQGLPASCAGLNAGSPCDDGDPETAARCSGGGQCIGDLIERPTSCLLEPDETPCDDDDPATLAYCENLQCVAVPLSVPEPNASASLLAAVAVLALLRRCR